MKKKIFAGIDIGTNTFRLLIAEVSSKGLKVLHSERKITRLGKGVSTGSLLDEEAVKKGVSALMEFQEIITAYKADAVDASATSAFRIAENNSLFIKKVRDETGIDIKIISEEEEALTTSRGVMMDIEVPESALIVDIGGGSTEFIFTKGKEPVSIRSLTLGAVYLADRHMKSDPPGYAAIKNMGDEISNTISHIEYLGELLSDRTVLIGTAGTITALAAMINDLKTFESGKIHKRRVSLNSIKDTFGRISEATAQERREMYPVLLPDRLDIIVPGTFILLKIMKTLGFKEITVSENGLREGILLDLFERTC